MAITASKVRLGTNSPDGCDAPGLHVAVVDVTTATKTLLGGESGALVVFNRAAGTTITLPALSSIRVGAQFKFVVPVTYTGTLKLITGAATDFLDGSINIGSLTLAEATDTFIANGSTHIAILADADTKGRLSGGVINVTAISATIWWVDGYLIGAGTLADPFSAS